MALCERCGQVLATRVVPDPTVGQARVCESCARQMTQSTYPYILLPALHAPLTPAVRACPGCGMTFQAFNQTSHLGCAVCYQHFREPLEVLIRRMHGASGHRGKSPARPLDRLREEAEGLREALQQAVSEERFEDAIGLRDQLRDLEGELGKGDPP